MTMTQTRLDFDLVDRMQKALRVADLGRTEIAARLGMSPNTITRWLSGRTVPRHRDLIAFAETTGVPLSWLESGTLDDVRPKGLEPLTFCSVAGRTDYDLAA